MSVCCHPVLNHGKVHIRQSPFLRTEDSLVQGGDCFLVVTACTAKDGQGYGSHCLAILTLFLTQRHAVMRKS